MLNLTEKGVLAARSKIDPAFLAMNFLTEGGRDLYLSNTPVPATGVGLDHWNSFRIQAEAQTGLTFSTGILNDPGSRWCSIMTSQGCRFVNRMGVDVGLVPTFLNGEDAALAVGARLRVLANGIEHAAAGGALEPRIYWMLVRLAYNPGQNNPQQMAAALALLSAAQQLASLPSSGDVGPQHPHRTAAARSGQMLHLSTTFFGGLRSCPQPPP